MSKPALCATRMSPSAKRDQVGELFGPERGIHDIRCDQPVDARVPLPEFVVARSAA